MTIAYEIITVDEIKTVMDEVVERFLIPRFNELKMNATGEWLANVGSEAEPNKGIIKGLDYTEELVKGQSPTTVPLNDLTKWAKAKFRLNDRVAQVVAKRVQTKIKEKGTSWYEKGGSSLLEVLEEPTTLNYIYMRLQAKATPRIEEQLIRGFRE